MWVLQKADEEMGQKGKYVGAKIFCNSRILTKGSLRLLSLKLAFCFQLRDLMTLIPKTLLINFMQHRIIPNISNSAPNNSCHRVTLKQKMVFVQLCSFS